MLTHPRPARCHTQPLPPSRMAPTAMADWGPGHGGGGLLGGWLYAVGDILEAKLIAKKGIWRGFKVLNPTRQNLNDKQGGQEEMSGKEYSPRSSRLHLDHALTNPDRSPRRTYPSQVGRRSRLHPRSRARVGEGLAWARRHWGGWELGVDDSALKRGCQRGA
jgi:hypothetical protein